ncbi:MAG: NTP transferase domain-containing protein, partial [Actinomycetota bacterium]|nr:NTP transferase domain-containing protein [Actinomycetota bacterium]
VPAVAAGVALVADAGATLVLAGDLPLISTSDLRRLLDRLAHDPPADAAAALDHRGRPNPLLAAYRTAVLGVARAPGLPAASLLPSRLATVELGPEATLNVNDPADLEGAAALLRSRGGPPSRRSSSPPGGSPPE